LTSATFTASENPDRQSPSDSVVSSSRSLMTAWGTVKAPRKFFLPKWLMPFLTPTPESSWARVVGGDADEADAPVGDRGGVAREVEQGAAPHRDEVGTAAEVGAIDQPERRVENPGIVLGDFTPREEDRIVRELDRVVRGGVGDGALGQIGLGVDEA
jgi:hypothetical protein